MLFWAILAAGILLSLYLARRAYKNSYYKRYRRSEAASAFGFGVLGTVVACVFSVIFGGIFVSSGGHTYVRTESTLLEALGNDSSTSGAFFLGSGYVDEKLTFNYLAKDADGGITLESVRADRAKVFEDATDEAVLIKQIVVLDNPWLFPFAIDDLADRGYHFHVPAGSVNNEYKVSVTG